MQMIADGKIKDGFEIKCTDGYDGIYVFRKEELKSKKGSTTIFNRYTLQVFLNVYFEILEYTTEEIEELDTTAENTLFTMEYYTGIPEKAQDWNFNILKNKIIEITRTVNKLNKQDTYKAENCMTD